VTFPTTKQLKSNQNTDSAFSKLKEKLAALVKRQSDGEQSERQACKHQGGAGNRKRA